MKKRSSKNKTIGITYGDPCSIGPEILSKALKKKHKFSIEIIGSGYSHFKPGRPSKLSGAHALENIKKSVELAKVSKIKALITGPVSKAIINKIQKGFKGQTSELARLCKIKKDKVIMLFATRDLKISLFTRHIPVSEVSKSLKKKDLEDHILLLNSELKKWFKKKTLKIGILGLNPHAGEEGLIGKEEIKVITPAIKSLKRKGLNVHGPLSPDATLAEAGQLYLNNKKQKYDVLVSMYHDQSLPMFKAVSGKEGLNVTLGLPFIRVSPDHGTAFDIAGKGIADPTGIISAINFLDNIL